MPQYADSSEMLANDRQVLAAPLPPPGRRAEYRITGAKNLVLRVTASGVKSWCVWFKKPRTGKWARHTLGTYPAMTLSDAKKAAVMATAQAFAGEDPGEARVRRRLGDTVRDLGALYLERHARPKKKSADEDERCLRVDVYPAIGDVAFTDIRRRDLVEVIQAIADRGAPIMANRCLALLRKMFNFAVAEGLLETSPAVQLATRAKERVKTRTLDDAELRTFWHAMSGKFFDEITEDALKLQLLLGARMGEITGMPRSELRLHLDPPQWVLPAARSKSNRDVIRPLPPLALSILRRRLSGLAADTHHVFVSPANTGAPITTSAPAKAIRRAAAAGTVPTGFTPHDLRRTARTGFARLGVPETVAKKILGHAPPRADVTASVYDQHTYIPEMLVALTRWEGLVRELVET